MKRCNNCFRFSLGKPLFCSYCGRSYGIRICPRGHTSARLAQFCPTCGSAELSTPAPLPSLLSRVSLGVVVFFVVALILLVLASVVASIIESTKFSVFAQPLTLLAVVIAILYWSTTLLPGRVRKVRRPGSKDNKTRRVA
jgi:hypothetical protein